MIFGERAGGVQAQLAERAALFGNPANSLGGPWLCAPGSRRFAFLAALFGKDTHALVRLMTANNIAVKG